MFVRAGGEGGGAISAGAEVSEACVAVRAHACLSVRACVCVCACMVCVRVVYACARLQERAEQKVKIGLIC